MSPVEILLTDSTNADFQRLAAGMEKELYGRDGPLAEINQELNKAENLSSVLVLYKNDMPVACGAFRPYNSRAAEIKRLYVEPSHRRKNLASQILSALELLAKEMKYKFCLLETGKNQPEAISFYSRKGYKPIENFGKYAGSLNSLCFSKRI